MKQSLLFALLLAGAGPAADRPNFLVILVDDMGYSDLGCYGSEIKTPNLDALAAGGIRYTRMTNTSKCWPTRISLLTGLYHLRTDRGFKSTATAGEVLRPAGYRTWWAGKHHAGFNPVGRGFDHFSGFLGGAINFWNPGDKAREGEPPPGWRAVYTWAFDDKLVRPYVPDKGFYSTDRFTDWALGWLDEAKGDDRPFFLYVAYNAPHWPLHAHPADIAKYEGVYDKGYAAIREARYKRQVESGLFDPKVAPLSEPDWGRDAWAALSKEERHKESMRMAIHAAMVDRVDQNVGRLVARLRERGKFDNTLILFLVDNGASAESPNRKGAPPEPWGSVGTFESIGRQWAMTCDTPLRLWKATSHEGGIATPMIAHWPRGIPTRGAICRERCHLIDLLPTWMELAGPAAKHPGESKEADIPPLDGVSLAPTFSGKPIGRKAPLFNQWGSGKAMIDGNWKLVRKKKSAWELYDLAADRTETNDLASANPDRVKSMERAWNVWYKACTGREPSVTDKKKKKKKPKK